MVMCAMWSDAVGLSRNRRTGEILRMPLSALSLVLLSAALHATWNFLLKRAGGTQEVVAMSKLAEAVLFAPVFFVGFTAALPPLPVTLWLTAVAAVGVGMNYVALAHAYRHGDLSVVYPIARGAILVFLPLVGYVALGERLSPVGVVGLASIVIGILTLNLPFSRASVQAMSGQLPGRATIWAVASGLVAAVYTAWDKRAVARMEPFAYMYLYTLFVAAGYAVWLRTRVERAEVRREWSQRWPSIVLIGLMNTASYLLALLALRTGVTSYVLGIRQVSIVGGVALGWRYLKEPLSPPRIVGVSCIVLGCLLLSIASARP
jgi:drug/metabolite transporter (DMT)-like permease